MSHKSAKFVTRQEAINMLLAEATVMSDKLLAELLDVVADNNPAFMSRFDRIMIREEEPCQS